MSNTILVWRVRARRTTTTVIVSASFTFIPYQSQINRLIVVVVGDSDVQALLGREISKNVEYSWDGMVTALPSLLPSAELITATIVPPVVLTITEAYDT